MKSASNNVYYAFGLAIESDWDIPCSTTPRVCYAAVKLERGAEDFFTANVPSNFRRPDPKRTQFHQLDDGSRYLLWKDIFEFHLSPDSKVITAQCLNQAPEQAFRTYMLGHFLAYVLLGLGIETIHAASVLIEGNAVGFLGDGAYGKSTLSAAFLNAGCPLISDDFLVLRQEGERAMTYPGFPRIKLYDRVAQHLITDGQKGTPMNEDHCPKMIYSIDLDRSEPAPVRAFYVLASPKAVRDVKEVRIESLTEREAYLELMANSFNVTVKTPKRLSSQFEWATELVKKVRVKRLWYPRVLSILPNVIEAVKRDLRNQENGSPAALARTLPARTR